MNSKGKKNTHTEKKLVLFLVFKIYKLMKLKAAEDKKERKKVSSFLRGAHKTLWWKETNSSQPCEGGFQKNAQNQNQTSKVSNYNRKKKFSGKERLSCVSLLGRGVTRPHTQQQKKNF
jgi:hypothetical protein